MSNFEWIVMAGFLAFGGLTFLRLMAGARQSAVKQAKAEADIRRLAEEEKRAEEAARKKLVPVTSSAFEVK